MKIAPTSVLGLSMTAGALVAAVGLSIQNPHLDLQAAPTAPVHASPAPPPPPPPPTSSAVSGYVPGNPDPNPGAEGGGGGGAGGGG